jgi:hypothetical protein
MAGCKHVVVDHVKILNDVRGANNDGIDPDSCKDVVITNCIIESGDDAIVVKNTISMGKKYGACENIIISNCILHSQDSALKIGTETYQAIRNVILSDCIIKDCSRGIGIWARDGAVIENIRVHDVIGSVRRYADRFLEEGNPGWWGKGEPVFLSNTCRYDEKEQTGIIQNVVFQNMEIACEAGIFMRADAGRTLKNIRLENIALTMKKIGTLDSGMFDEQPSPRGKYAHEVPALYANGWSEETIMIENCSRVVMQE